MLVEIKMQTLQSSENFLSAETKEIKLEIKPMMYERLSLRSKVKGVFTKRNRKSNRSSL